MHSTTTFRRIVGLYDEARQLLDKRNDDWLTDDDQARFAEIRVSLDAMWSKRRAELVFQTKGSPRMVSAPDPRSQPQVKRFAHGIAPLPSGGD